MEPPPSAKRAFSATKKDQRAEGAPSRVLPGARRGPASPLPGARRGIYSIWELSDPSFGTEISFSLGVYSIWERLGWGKAGTGKGQDGERPGQGKA